MTSDPIAMPLPSPRQGVGAPVVHDSAVKHVVGNAVYIDDMPEPKGCLHVHPVLSRWAHARIAGIDGSAALALPGVRAVVTAADIPGHNDIAGRHGGDPALPPDTVSYIGHIVAVVAADTPALARKAAALVAVTAEPLPAILDVREALAQDSYVIPPMVMTRGEPGPELERAPHRLKGELLVGGQEHFYLETQVTLAVPQEDGGMHIYASTQNPTETQSGVAAVLGVPQSAVNCEVRRMGGGFGGKESQAGLVACLAALAARKTRRPCKLRLTRDDDMIATGKRHPFLLSWDVGCDDQGRILAVEMQIVADAGWSVDLTPGVLGRALSHADNAYFYPHARIVGLAAKTNKASNTAFRGFGGPQGMIGCEAMMDHIARALKLDPLAVRRINFYGGPDRTLTPYHQEVTHFRIPAMVTSLLDSSDYARRRQAVDAFNAASPVIRKGLALSPVKFGISFTRIDLNQAGALVNVYEDGSILLNHGGTEMGQGLFTKVAQIVAEVFSVDVSMVRLSPTSTAKIPNTAPTAASTGTDLNGMAALLAAEAIKDRLTDFAAERFDVPRERVRFEDGEVIAGNHHLPFAELVRLARWGRVNLFQASHYRTPDVHWDNATQTGHPCFYYAHGVAVSEVAIDTLTGEWRPLRVDLLHDVGASINPAIDKGQVEGAFIQGMGWLTMEELVWSAEGRLLTHAPSTYKIPTARDMPPDFRVELLPRAPNEVGTVFRSKAVGEPPLMLAISVWLALRDAVASLAGPGYVPDLAAPATPERILNAVIAARAAAPQKS